VIVPVIAPGAGFGFSITPKGFNASQSGAQIRRPRSVRMTRTRSNTGHESHNDRQRTERSTSRATTSAVAATAIAASCERRIQ
jgi:hypothetical protein